MKKIAYITNASADSGVGHQAMALYDRLAEKFPIDYFFLDGERGQMVTQVAEESKEKRGRRLGSWPGVLGSKTINWIRLARQLEHQLRSSSSPYIYHVTNQTLSFMNKNLRPAIVTVHDLIEVLSPQSVGSGLAARYLYSGIKRADQLITVSQYTAQTIHDYYGLPFERIAVIYNGVDEVFHPIYHFKQTITYHTWRQELKLPAAAKIVLLVSSDHPRKNVVTALRTFAKVRRADTSVYFIKVGQPGIAAGRETTLQEIDRLHLRPYIRLLGSVSLEQLNELYNLADVLLHPSRFEGFGLPPVQAMACGTPVVTANTTSLPEVVGQAGLVHEPDDVEGFALDVSEILSDQVLSKDLRQKGIQQAQHFSWDKAASSLSQIYQRWL